MIIPGFIIAWLTFPGVIVHEFAHKIFCHLTGTKVIKVCYFQFGNPAGYVIHERPTSTWKHILIGIGPLFINSVTGFVIALLAIPLKGPYGNSNSYIIVMWLAVSIAMHSFPSTIDAKSIWGALWRPWAPIWAKVVGTPLVGLIFVGALGSIVWLDLMYGFGIAVGIPEFLHLS